MWLFKHKRGPFFGLNHRVTQVDRTYYWSERVVPRRKACHRSMVSFHVVTEKSNHQPTNQPTTTTKNTRHLSNNNNQTSAHIFYPKPSFILELVVVVRSFFIYLFIFCCCSSCNTFKTDSSRFSLVGVYAADKEKSPANGGW